MTTTKVPKRLRIKPFMSIDGVRPNERLCEGLYITGVNLSEDEARILASDEFSHCVELLADEPEPEQLATSTPLPKDKSIQSRVIQQRKKYDEQQREKEVADWQKVHGRTHPPVTPNTSNGQ